MIQTKTFTQENMADREIVVSRLLDAPRELAFDAFTDAAHISNWWGPKGFTTTTHEADFSTGGVWRFTMHGPDGKDYPNKVVYNEVTRPVLLSYQHSGDDVDGKDLKFGATVLFEERQGKTLVTLRLLLSDTAARDHVMQFGALEGAHDTLSRLDAHLADARASAPDSMAMTLPSDREVRLVRTYTAPASLVFKAFTTAEYMRQWWGPAAFEVATCEVDFRVGGEWRVVHRTPEGQEHPFRGVYKEIVPDRRLVYTFIYDVEGARDHEAVETVYFDELDGKTVLTNTVTHDSKVSRDAALQSGMESGARETLDRLASFLQGM